MIVCVHYLGCTHFLCTHFLYLRLTGFAALTAGATIACKCTTARQAPRTHAASAHCKNSHNVLCTQLRDEAIGSGRVSVLLGHWGRTLQAFNPPFPFSRALKYWYSLGDVALRLLTPNFPYWLAYWSHSSWISRRRRRRTKKTQPL